MDQSMTPGLIRHARGDVAAVMVVSLQDRLQARMSRERAPPRRHQPTDRRPICQTVARGHQDDPVASYLAATGRSASRQAVSRVFLKTSAGCAPETPYRRSITKKGTPVMPSARDSRMSAVTSSA